MSRSLIGVTCSSFSLTLSTSESLTYSLTFHFISETHWRATAELAHELMCIQLSVLLALICHIVLVISDGTHADHMWHLMSTVDLLKHGIPDPSSVSSVSSSSEAERDKKR